MTVKNNKTLVYNLPNSSLIDTNPAQKTTMSPVQIL